ncbi:hypothetical protein [uncultured Algibacter sp.]|uniref:hypothetical protein n=1 Tax=uncultured Algibacter sp. TaxID=298659 RepID=UPI0026167305|nr:hypothetical protein [uncultured Algibacter sp.]
MIETYLILCNALDGKLDTVLRKNNYFPKMGQDKLQKIEQEYVSNCSDIILSQLEETELSIVEKQKIENALQPIISQNLKKNKWLRYYELSGGYNKKGHKYSWLPSSAAIML